MWKGIIMPWGKELPWNKETQQRAVPITELELTGSAITNDEFDALSWEKKAILLQEQVAVMRQQVGGHPYQPPEKVARAIEKNVPVREPENDDRITALIDETADIAIAASEIITSIDQLLASS